MELNARNDLDAPRPPTVKGLLVEGGRAMILLLFAAAGLRAFIGTELWLDEILMLHDYVRAPLGKVVTSYPNDNNHPLYSLLASALAKLFGESPTVLRLPAAVFGLLAIPATYVFARRFAGRVGALLAAALIGLGFHGVYFSLNARGYTALLLASLVATETFLRSREGARRAWIVHAVALGLGAYAHLTGAFVGVGHALVQLAIPGSGGRRAAAPWKGIFGGGGLAVLLHAPMAKDLWTFFVARPDREAVASEWKSPLTQAVSALSSVGMGSAVAGGVVVAVGGVVAWFGVRTMFRRDRAALAAAFLPAFLGAATTLALGRHLWPRFFFFAFGFAATVGAVAVVALARKRAAPVACVLAAAALVTGSFGAGTKQDFSAARRHIRTLDATEDRPVRVFTVGLAMWPYKYGHETNWTPAALGDGDRPVDDPRPILAALERSALARATVRVVACSPIFMKSRQPKTAALIEERFEIDDWYDRKGGRWRRTVFGGAAGRELDVVVYRPKGSL